MEGDQAKRNLEERLGKLNELGGTARLPWSSADKERGKPTFLTLS